ncbi:uncharacterized protein BDZ83DRAFT_729990 [Colletotrichum acutatum]|uniref:Uncharacterized protein n=1 Tax=Glomerella acutata TaxID=27357 RepID=A0AAD8XGW6_GLOAC|nr:uncharacterized protein BDZ83DRAFT_729990 [Colletotrichum acutatum]KAK1725851.1 hypothetical protein BDZ83DRAFT_729990 [Colletotrichum acutatum]
MKFSVLILPVLASGITALYVPDKLVQAFLKDSSEGNCCNETPCFIGCPVEGVFRYRVTPMSRIPGPKKKLTLSDISLSNKATLAAQGPLSSLATIGDKINSVLSVYKMLASWSRVVLFKLVPRDGRDLELRPTLELPLRPS